MRSSQRALSGPFVIGALVRQLWSIAGSSSRQDNNPPLIQFFEELKTHPNIPYKPWGPGLAKIIPSEFR